jgi:hypothetical protein
MQVLNDNSSAQSKTAQNLPKPVPPQVVSAKTNTPVKNPIAPVESPSLIIQSKQSPAQKDTIHSKPPVAPPATAPSMPVVPTVLKTKASDEKLVPTEQIGKKNRKKTDKKNKKSDKKPGKKGIPTILGLLFLVGSLIAGIILFGNGTGLFAPRATPETTPKNIFTSNVTDKSFTVSFYTDEETIGFIKYGTGSSDIKQQASDDRDQLSGVIKPYRLHHVTVRGLEPNTNYHYLLGTGSKATFDNAGNPYQIKTASNLGSASPNNQTIYGTVSQANGQPGEGAIVFVTLEGAGALSTLVKSSGSWAISLANAFNLGLNDYPAVREDSVISVKVQGVEMNSITSRVLDLANAQPVPEIIMGQEVNQVDDKLSLTREELLGENNEEFEDLSNNVQEIESIDNLAEDSLITEEVTESTKTSTNQDIALTDEDRTLDLDMLNEASGGGDNVINSTQPIIKANLPANITVKIEVHSDAVIETVMETDANGNLALDIASLKESLSPGEHTIIYTYIDPNTGKEVSKSYDFTVSEEALDYGRGADAESRTIASNETRSLPYGTGDPYLPNANLTPFPSPIATSTATPQAATSSARETVVSTESGTYNAGSIFTTLGLLLTGLFFLATGAWSFILAKQFKNY